MSVSTKDGRSVFSARRGEDLESTYTTVQELTEKLVEIPADFEIVSRNEAGDASITAIEVDESKKRVGLITGEWARAR